MGRALWAALRPVVCLRTPVAPRHAAWAHTSVEREEPAALMRKLVDRMGPAATKNLAELSRRWNTFSGYEAIEELKTQVALETKRLQELQQKKNEAKDIYMKAVAARSAAQRDTNDLLSRKPTWNDNDLAVYTKLLHSEHSYAKEQERSEQRYDDAEAAVQRGFDELMSTVMRRYHDEHLWSDRIRSVSTYVHIALAVMNVLVFMLAILLVEPYKRRKLAQTLEARLVQGEEGARLRMQDVVESIEGYLEELAGGRRHGRQSAEMPALPAQDAEVLAPAQAPAPLARPAQHLPIFTWVSEVTAVFDALRVQAAQLFERVNPFPDMSLNVVATVTGVALATCATWLLSLAM
ncbi:sensitivity to high expression protein she9 [Malassezia sp. CBS 17886]|nr:sensitivity to high expression protein she9 [Malassezia sp. CBS 17886]